MSLFNWKMVFAAFCIMFLSTACSKKIMPPEIETSSGGIEDSDFTASNASPTEEETEETDESTSGTGEIGGSGGSSSASDFFSEEPILEGPSDGTGAGTDTIAENSFSDGTGGSNMGEFGKGSKANIDNGSDGSFSAENPFVAGDTGNTDNSGMDGNSGMGGNGGTIGNEEAARLIPYKETSQLQDIHFNFDKYDLDGNAKKTLQQNAAFLKRNPGMRIEIQGHCDERGTNNYNLSLIHI